jgi:hypothetical protein
MRDRLMPRTSIVPALFVLLFVLGVLRAQTGKNKSDHHTAPKPISANEPPIRITINPEARVSVTLASELPPAVPCGTTVDLQVKIVNQGFVTSRLEAGFVGDVPPGIILDFPSVPLKGVPEEFRNLRITLTKPDPADLTIAFKAHNEIPDLGGRDRLHFLMHCLQTH